MNSRKDMLLPVEKYPYVVCCMFVIEKGEKYKIKI